ncbi:signal peptidase II [Thermoflavimicrobium daqui]|uniref:Lipoprotein signal peptidase n=1 Tax=Thermoflavimicrobium daqui TaxID=2137476 RepID=A0A364K703_9BACL|nr:signal peptidase II [Thermoflavimicrobium daqui]RAL26073.1 signal peptidase II [Thermoflavimicrobium daqui]
MRYFLLAIVIVALDQWSKWLVVSKMVLSESIPIIDGFFYITSHRNRGAAFGILENQQWLFIIVTFLVIGGVIYYIWKEKKSSQQPVMLWALSLILGGAIGNLIDRIRSGEVVDFIHLQFGSYHYPIFNIADSAIVIGVILFAIFMLFTPDIEKKKNQEVGES